jgi:O-antigen/teichoic acid export membrane protein
LIYKLLNIIKQNKQFNNLIIYGIGQGFNLITPLLVIPYIVSKCGVENYGKASIGMAISFFLMVFVDYGSDIIGVKEVAVNRDNKIQLEEIFITTYTSKFLLLIGTLLVTSLLFCFVPFFVKEKQLFFLCLPILVGQFINPTWYLQGIENFKWITFLTITSKLIYLSGIFLFIQHKSDYVLINLFWGIGTIISNGITLIYLFNKNSYSVKKASIKDALIQIKDNFSIFTSQIFVSLQMYAPIMLLGFFGNNLMAGHYKIIEQIIVIFKTYIFLFFNFVYPRVCYLLETNLKKGIVFWKTYNGVNFVFIALIMFVIYLIAPQVVTYFTKTNINVISNILQFAILLPILLAISIPLKQLVLGFNHKIFYIKTTMIMVIFNLIGIILIIPYLKIFGVFLSLILTEFITIVIYYFKIRKEIEFKII